MVDFIMNGTAHGDSASRLLANELDPAMMRPYFNERGEPCFTINIGGQPREVVTTNANATLTKDAWIALDNAVRDAAKPRLRAVSDLMSRGLSVGLDGMSTTVFQSQALSDLTDAKVTMDGQEEASHDRIQTSLDSLPLPIIEKDFGFSKRQINVSQKGGAPLDLTGARLAGQKVAEMIEKMLIGDIVLPKFSGANIYGYKNFPSALTKTITEPTGAWTAATTVQEVLAMRSQAYAAYHYGPYMLYYGPSWSAKMDDEYKSESSVTLANRLRAIDDIVDVKRLDHLSGYELILVQLSPEVIRMVNGMDITTVQWATDGGMGVRFKVMAIMVPQLRADYYGRTGIVYGSI